MLKLQHRVKILENPNTSQVEILKNGSSNNYSANTDSNCHNDTQDKVYSLTAKCEFLENQVRELSAQGDDLKKALCAQLDAFCEEYQRANDNDDNL